MELSTGVIQFQTVYSLCKREYERENVRKWVEFFCVTIFVVLQDHFSGCWVQNVHFSKADSKICQLLVIDCPVVFFPCFFFVFWCFFFLSVYLFKQICLHSFQLFGPIRTQVYPHISVQHHQSSDIYIFLQYSYPTVLIT